MSNLILEIKDVSHSYADNTATLKNINLEVGQGEKVSILGPSGSGKSTLLRLVAGLERPQSGSISIRGETVSTKDFVVAPEKRKLGLVVQEKALFPHLTVKENITFGIKKMLEKNQIASELCSLFKIDHLKGKYPHEISGGEQQRTALARSMAPNPELLMLDEPFSALDQKLKEELYFELNQIFEDRKQTILIVSHDLKEAEALSQRQINI